MHTFKKLPTMQPSVNSTNHQNGDSAGGQLCGLKALKTKFMIFRNRKHFLPARGASPPAAPSAPSKFQTPWRPGATASPDRLPSGNPPPSPLAATASPPDDKSCRTPPSPASTEIVLHQI